MLAEELRTPDHISTMEYPYVVRIIKLIRDSGYGGPIRVVGSRTEGARVSARIYASECADELAPAVYGDWYDRLNDIARQHDIPAGSIREIGQFLPDDTPEPIRSLFDPQRSWIHLETDLDLEIDDVPAELLKRHDDDPPPMGSGLTIDIFLPEHRDYVHLPGVYDY